MRMRTRRTARTSERLLVLELILTCCRNSSGESVIRCVNTAWHQEQVQRAKEPTKG